MILCAHSTSRSSELSKKRRSCSNNMWEVCMIIKLGRHIFWEVHGVHVGLFFCFPKADWLGRKTLNTWMVWGLNTWMVWGLNTWMVWGLNHKCCKKQHVKHLRLRRFTEAEERSYRHGSLHCRFLCSQTVCGLWCSQHFYKAIITQQSALGNTSLLKWR